MTAAPLDFGSLNEPLQHSCAAENLARSVDRDYREQFPDVVASAAAGSKGSTRDLMRSSGPISDAYILGFDPVMLITGPGGSGKTTASVKKALVEAQRVRPGSDGVRRYVLGVWRQKYVNLWNATIPSWWSILPKDLSGSTWVGAAPRAATHIVRFEDGYGPIELIALFRAFGEAMDPQDLKGNQFTDVWLNELDTLPEHLFVGLADRIGRDPPREVLGRGGRYFADSNPPDVLNYCYRDFYEDPKPGYRLFRQPGGREPAAENIAVMGREYYENSARINAHRPWWVRVMVDAKPGYLRPSDPVYPSFDDDRNLARATIPVLKDLPVLVGVDNPMKPAAAYMQERGDGQLRILAEVALERGGIAELATAMLALEGTPRFSGCEFVTTCDPAMGAGEDLEAGSLRSQLAGKLARGVDLASTNNVDIRIGWLGDKLAMNVAGGEPGLIIDPSCKSIRRGFNQTYHWHVTSGTNDRSRVEKTADSHIMEAGQYGASRCGTAAARHRQVLADRDRHRRRQENRTAKRYNPNSYAAGRGR